MIDLDELGKLREYLGDDTVKHLIETERDRTAFGDAGCKCVLCVSRHGLLAMMQQVRRSVKAHATVAKLYGRATAERDAALARIADLEATVDAQDRQIEARSGETTGERLFKARAMEAEARIAEAAKLHRKITLYSHEDSCPDTSDEHREERHSDWGTDPGEYYCLDMIE